MYLFLKSFLLVVGSFFSRDSQEGKLDLVLDGVRQLKELSMVMHEVTRGVENCGSLSHARK